MHRIFEVNNTARVEFFVLHLFLFVSSVFLYIFFPLPLYLYFVSPTYLFLLTLSFLSHFFFTFVLLRIIRMYSLVSCGEVRLSPLGTSATNWLIVPAPDDR
jgi:hypothetical protein